MPEPRTVSLRDRISLFQLALAGSLIVHLALLFGPVWSLPSEIETVRIDASLRLPPSRPSAVAPVEKPKPVKKARKRDVAKPARPGKPPALITRSPDRENPAPSTSVVTAESAEPVPVPGGGGSDPQVDTRTAAAAEPVAASDPAPVSIDPEATQAWPKEGRIRYQVRYGDTVQVAQMVLNWSHDGERYTMRAEASTVGLARLIKRFSATQQSQGRVGPEGLAPTGFQEDLNGKQSHAVFDWAAHKVMLSRPDGVRELPIVGIAQDILSLAHHLSFQPDSAERIRLLVVAGRWGAEAELSQVANEVLRLPWGSMATRHFHCETRNGEFGVDIWLARDHRNAPIRIRVDDRKQGYVVDQIAQEIDLDGIKVHFGLTPEERELYKG